MTDVGTRHTDEFLSACKQRSSGRSVRRLERGRVCLTNSTDGPDGALTTLG